MLSYRRETALQGALVLAKTGRMQLADNNHCDTISLQSYRIRWKKSKIRDITPFNVIQGHRGRYQSKARMRFPISDTDILSRTVS